MNEAKFVRFIYMQPQKVKFKSVQINMKQVSYVVLKTILSIANVFMSFDHHRWSIIIACTNIFGKHCKLPEMQHSLLG